MKLLFDMNLPPSWCELFHHHGHETSHWSRSGDPKATDRAIMEFALASGFVVVTHDLDFGALLAATGARGPSVVLVRAGDVSDPNLTASILDALLACADELAVGAIVTVDETSHRVRVLPLAR
jgi:predicted nuclease of predicted toxin-antitoxin system